VGVSVVGWVVGLLGSEPPGRSSILEILDLHARLGRLVKRCVGDLIVRDRDAETGAKLEEFLLVHFLLIVGDVSTFPSLT